MLISRNIIATEKMMSMKFCKYWKKIVADSSSSLSVYSFTDCLSILSTTLQFQCTNYLCWEVSQWPYLFMCLLKIIGKEFPKNCYKTIFRKISTEEIFFQLTLITNKDYFSRKKAQFAKIYCRGICDLYLWS